MGYPNPTVQQIHDQTVMFARSVYSVFILGMMTQLMATSRGLADALYMGFTYMRWLDDICDESPMPMEEKLALLEENISRLRRWKTEDLDEVTLFTLRIEERCAYFFVKDSIQVLKARGMKDKRIDEYLENFFEMITSIEVDTKNHGRIIPSQEFYEHVYYKRAGVGFMTSPYLTLNDPSDNLIKAFEYFGYLWQVNNDNIGIAKDLKCDMYNITKEEVEKHKIDFDSFRGDYNQLVLYLGRETTFFEDRVNLLKRWGRIVKENISDLPFFQRILARRAVDLMTPDDFKPGSTHYDLLIAIYSFDKDKYQYMAWISTIFMPEWFELFLLRHVIGVGPASTTATDAVTTA